MGALSVKIFTREGSRDKKWRQEFWGREEGRVGVLFLNAIRGAAKECEKAYQVRFAARRRRIGRG